MNNDRVLLGGSFLTLAVLLWAGNTIIGKMAVDGNIPPIALGFWRWAIALGLIFPFTASTLWTKRAEVKKNWRVYLVFGIASVGCFNTFFYVGLESTTAIQGALIMATLPVSVVLAARIFMKVPITPLQMAGILISVPGAALIVVRGDPARLLALDINIGDFWCLMAVFAWTVQILNTRKLPPSVGMWANMTVSIAVGVAFLLPIYLIEIASGRTLPMTGLTAISIGYTALAASIAAFYLWNSGVVFAGPSASGYFGNLFPVFSAILAIVILGDRLEWFHLAGGALVLLGIYFATIHGARAAQK